MTWQLPGFGGTQTLSQELEQAWGVVSSGERWDALPGPSFGMKDMIPLPHPPSPSPCPTPPPLREVPTGDLRCHPLKGCFY